MKSIQTSSKKGLDLSMTRKNDSNPNDKFITGYDILTKEKDILDYLKKEVQKTLTGEDIAVQIILLSILSALLLEKPFGVVIYSASSSGKSYIVNSILECFGDKYDAIEQDGINITIKPGFGFISANSLTLAGLTRLTQNNPRCFDNKVLLLHEISDATGDEVKHVYQALRQFVSNGYYDRILTDEKTKKPMRLKLEGWCACISESAEQIIEIQWGNRFIFVNLDESAKQNKAIAEFQAQEYLTPWNKEFPNVELFDDLVWALQDDRDEYKCRKISVVNPWAEDIIKFVHTRYGDDVRLRRFIPILLKAVETITRLHYTQRETTVHPVGLGVMIAKRWDNAKILSLFDQMLLHTLKNITTGALNLLIQIDEEFDDEEWTVRNLSQRLDVAYSTARNKTRMLLNYGLIKHVGREGRAYLYRVSKTGKNYSLNCLQVTWSDYMHVLPPRELELTPLTNCQLTSGMTLTPGQLTVDKPTPTEVIGENPNNLNSPSLDKVSLEKRSDIFIIENIRNLVLKWLDNSEEGFIHIRELLDMLKLNGYERAKTEKTIDEMVKRGWFFYNDKNNTIMRP